MPQTQENLSLGNRVFDRLRERILDGELATGQGLIEAKLSQEYGVSRTPVRDAVHRLELEGLVKIVPNKGAIVCGLSDRDILDIYQIRMKLEAMAACLAAQNINEEALMQLKESVELLEFYIIKGNSVGLGLCDSKFHRIIYEASKSRPLASTLKNLHSYSRRAGKESFRIEGRPEKVLTEHRLIYEAIEKRDQEKAQQLAQVHIENALASYSRQLDMR